MSFNFCPLCGAARLVQMDEPAQHTCFRCHHIFRIVDVLEDAMAKANSGGPLFFVPTDEELAAEQAADQAGQGGGL